MNGINSDKIHKLESLIANSSDIAIVTHMKPDGDAVGSSTAMFHYLKHKGCNTRIVLNDMYPGYLDFITCGLVHGTDIIVHEREPQAAVKAIEDADLIICLDFNAFHRTDRLEKTLERSGGKKILIDHHLNPDTGLFDLYFSETEVSSASELLYQILMQTDCICGDAAKLPAACATSLLTGMTTDTNNFANSVYPSTLTMTSELISCGVDRNSILEHLYNRYSENRLRLMGHMMKDLLAITQDDVAYIVLDKETQERYSVAEGDTEGFVNMPLSIGRVKMSILAKEDKDRVRISIRSKKGTSANMCAIRHFNGGGHENAAGGKLLIPTDIEDIRSAAAYIEEKTHSFMNETKR